MYPINGFSKLNRLQKISALSEQHPSLQALNSHLDNYLHANEQSFFNEISENTLSNFYLPYSIAPNFLINGVTYHVPMVIEESSVVAAASKGARFWAKHGGFTTIIKETIKTGQIHFEWHGAAKLLNINLPKIESMLREAVSHLTKNMERRGGGIVGMQIMPTGNADMHLWQLLIEFETADSMGANFINSCLEAMRQPLETMLNSPVLGNDQHPASVIMCILSNYTPRCIVKCTVECNIDDLSELSGAYTPHEFAQRFNKAIYIATHDSYRAATHNKGIFNGIDAVTLATGNDFRAVESNGHTHAASQGAYKSLTRLKLTAKTFSYTLEVPIAIGTVGGLTTNHPLAKTSLQLMGHPNSKQLMAIAAAVGLSNNFMAVTSLITHGIQKGHMKMHLTNICRSLNATEQQVEAAKLFFADKTVSYSAVKTFLNPNDDK